MSSDRAYRGSLIERRASMFHVFRLHARERKRLQQPTQRVERLTIDEASVRHDVIEDLHLLFGSLRLELTVALGEYSQVRKSIINFGVGDLTQLVPTKDLVGPLKEHIRQTLTFFEPRISPEDLEIEHEETYDLDQRIRISISGTLLTYDRRIPFDMEANVDLTEGKIAVRRRGTR